MDGLKWFRLDSGVSSAPVVKRLAKCLGVDRLTALGAYVRVQDHVAHHYPDGVLVDVEAEDLEEWLGVASVPDSLVDALVDVRLLERRADGVLVVAGWGRRHQYWLAERERARRRAEKRQRERAAEETAEGTTERTAVMPRSEPRHLPTDPPTDPPTDLRGLAACGQRVALLELAERVASEPSEWNIRQLDDALCRYTGARDSAVVRVLDEARAAIAAHHQRNRRGTG